MDLRNEPHFANKGGSCWDCGIAANDWHRAAERAGNAVLAVNPRLLIFVEGTGLLRRGTGTGGAATSKASRRYPVVLNSPGQLVYSAHDYGPVETKQTWFNCDHDAGVSLRALWSRHWAYIAQQNIAPVWLGEFGTTADALDAVDTTPGSQGQWFSSMVQFLGANSNIQWTYWALNGEDRYGLLNRGYDLTSAQPLKQTMLPGTRAGF